MKHKTPPAILPGAVVRSVKGRDRFRAFAVIALDTENQTAPLVVSDGRLHPIEKPKHKNPGHVRLIGMPGEMDREILRKGPTNGQIAEICAKVEKRFGNEKKPLDRDGRIEL